MNDKNKRYSFENYEIKGIISTFRIKDKKKHFIVSTLNEFVNNDRYSNVTTVVITTYNTFM